jgi:peptidyl-prolyl cis-trans isomerase SurA
MPTLRRAARGGFLCGAFALALFAMPLLAITVPVHAAETAAKGKDKPPAERPLTDRSAIVAVVNGDVISNGDIANRARLFAISTGLPVSQGVIERLRPQILKQLIDERLRVQEGQRQRIVIGDAQIAAAIKEIEGRNNLPSGALRKKLAADGVSTRTLIDQLRAQLAWQQLLRQAVADHLVITDTEIAEQQKLAAAQTGQTEYRIGEIFIPIDDPASGADAQKFAETVISELHAGASFPLVAAQFSQNQSALEGGEVGWVQTNQLDQAVARVVTAMPVGAVSNPIRVPGGVSVVTLIGKRTIGNEPSLIGTIRQAFFPFTSMLTDQLHPTDQQRDALAKARAASASIRGCEQMETFAKSLRSEGHAVDPGEIRIDVVNPPAFRQLMATIPLGKATEPLVSRDGIAVIVVCSRETRNVGQVTAADVQKRLANERIEMLSRQMMRDLHRRGTIDIRESGA